MQQPPDNGQPSQPTPQPGQYPQYPMQGPPQFPPYPQQPMPPGYQFQPPQGPYYPPQQPPKKSRKGLWIVLAVVLVLAVVTCGLIGMAASATPQTDNTSSSTSSSAPATGTWTTTHTYNGNGIQKTGTFTAPDDWKLLWTCDPTSFGGDEYNLIVTVTNADGSIADVAVNALCKPGQTSGSTDEHQGGSVYLDVNSEGLWNLKVQELK